MAHRPGGIRSGRATVSVPGSDDHSDGDEQPPEPSRSPVTLQLRVRAQARAVPLLRERMHAWLTALAWPPDHVHDLLLATTEACANAVEHAYPPGGAGEMRIGLRVLASGNNRRRAIIVVRDWGRWRHPPTSGATVVTG